MNRGALYAASAYVAWGLFPLYFRALAASSLEVMMHRLVWCLASLVAVLAIRRSWSWIGPVVRDPRALARLGIGALLISINWYVYIWATQHGHVVDASLGYFITPLVIVLLGRVALGERLRRGQVVAIALAAAGVAWLSWQVGHPPWIGLTLAICFGSYGLLKKTMTLGSFESLVVETAMLAPFALAGIAWFGAQGENHFAAGDTLTTTLLVASGPVTAIPLLLFAAGARRIPMTTLGLLQFIAPIIQMMLGVWVMGETVTQASLAGHALVWMGLATYIGESALRRREPEPAATT